MGHMSGKDIYRKLGSKLDKLPTRAPWNERLRSILKELYTAEEADLVVRMPFGLSGFDRIQKITKVEPLRLIKLLETASSKGLVVDLFIQGRYYYMPSPLIVGFFEFTMMRTGDQIKSREWAELFYRYLNEDDSYFAANMKGGEKVSVMRTLPHEQTLHPSDYTEILDYERAASLIQEASVIGIGLCACRHETHHLGVKRCSVPLESCTSFGLAAEYLIRHNHAREISKAEMLDHLARSREMGLVLNADNVRNKISFMCHCCKCCCYALLGISELGYANTLVTSNYMAQPDHHACSGCGTCATACPIHAIGMVQTKKQTAKKKKESMVDRSICLGCGVCALTCKTGAMRLIRREKRVILPETTFQRVILQSLEKGTLQNQLFDNPQSMTHEFMRGFVGGFLKIPPVKKALMSDMLRSSFLKFMERGASQRRGLDITEI